MLSPTVGTTRSGGSPSPFTSDIWISTSPAKSTSPVPETCHYIGKGIQRSHFESKAKGLQSNVAYIEHHDKQNWN
jgi:hypothetical protein